MKGPPAALRGLSEGEVAGRLPIARVERIKPCRAPEGVAEAAANVQLEVSP